MKLTPAASCLFMQSPEEDQRRRRAERPSSGWEAGVSPALWTGNLWLHFLQAFEYLFDYLRVQELAGMKRDYKPSSLLKINSMASFCP